LISALWYKVKISCFSHGVNSLSSRIYEKLAETFRSPPPNPDEIDYTLLALRVVALLDEDDVAQKSYNLFHVVMAPTYLSYSEKKWDASRLIMHTAYKWDKHLPWVQDPQFIFSFLIHHFDLAARGGQDWDEPIQDALRALGYASNPQALKHLHVTNPSFIHGLCTAFQNNKPFQLRKAALFFLPLIGDRWFNTPDKIMELDQMMNLCINWASTVDSIEHTIDVQKATLAVLFDMINSPYWRRFILIDSWKLLEYFTSVPGHSQSLKRCLDNPDLIHALRAMGNLDIMALWLEILCWKYKGLAPQIQEQLGEVLEETAQDGDRTYADICQSVIDSQLEKAQGALRQCDMQPTSLPAINLKRKIETLKVTRESLLAVQRGGDYYFSIIPPVSICPIFFLPCC